MSTEEQLTRINFEVPDEINEQLNKLIPKGSKSDVYRMLTTMYLEACNRYGRAIVIHLLDGKTELRLKQVDSNTADQAVSTDAT